MFSSILNLFGKNPDRYVTESAFSTNRTKQTVMTPQTVGQLRKYGVTDETELKLEFFFYTNAESKASELAKAIKDKKYSVKIKPAHNEPGIYLITGWTENIKMTDALVIAWTIEMCELGYTNDCDFDGWGTNPKK